MFETNKYGLVCLLLPLITSSLCWSVYILRLRCYVPWDRRIMAFDQFKPIWSTFHPEAGDSLMKTYILFINSDTVFVHSLKKLIFYLGPDVCFHNGMLSMWSRYYPVCVYNREKLTSFMLVYLSCLIQSIIWYIIWVFINKIIEQALTYIQGKGVLQQPKNT